MSTDSNKDFSVSPAKNAAIKKILEYVEEDNTKNIKQECKSRFLCQNTAPKGIVVLFHGFTAGTWQFESFEQELFKKGYHVFIPRLPGHGFYYPPEGKQNPEYIPLSHQYKDYLQFALKIYQLVKTVGLPIHLGGLSGGGAIAALIAQRNEDIKSLVLYAPYFNPGTFFSRLSIYLVNLLEKITGWPIAKMADKMPYDLLKREKSSGNIKRDIDIFCHNCVVKGQIFALTRFSHNVLHSTKNILAKTLLYTTETDILAHNASTMQVFNLVQSKKYWIHYDKKRSIPHSMVSKRMHNHEDVVDEMVKNLLDFLEDKSIDHANLKLSA